MPPEAQTNENTLICIGDCHEAWLLNHPPVSRTGEKRIFQLDFGCPPTKDRSDLE